MLLSAYEYHLTDVGCVNSSLVLCGNNENSFPLPHRRPLERRSYWYQGRESRTGNDVLVSLSKPKQQCSGAACSCSHTMINLFSVLTTPPQERLEGGGGNTSTTPPPPFSLPLTRALTYTQRNARQHGKLIS
ncbi:hypothetical protein BaRGS_00011725 [Batillaria attramentaria]|uniref:Uncharacterized protein n=1 Tax=Batillaria attramentaria TaxID=370345 RepID=A0ABD0LDC8_9CAEN